jgi:pimeloyl-ACP methyl ester carboxylesterase
VSTPPFLEPPEGVRAHRLSTARGDFAVLSAPAGVDTTPGPPVLLVPGFTGSKEDFIAVLGPIAAAGHPVTALDLRGQFETPGGDDPTAYDVKELAEDLLSVVGRLGGPVHLVGHSFGGLVARAAALADPSALRSLTLLDSGPAAIPHPASSNLALMVQALPTTDLETIWTVKRQLELSSRPGPPPHIEDWLRTRFLANHPVALRRLAEQLLDENDRTDELAAVGLPVLVAFGARDDAWPPALQRQMASRLDADLVVFADAAHSPAAECPEATAEALISFWFGTD